MKRRVVRHAVVQPPDQSYRLIALTQNQNAIVDFSDFEFLNQWNWYAHWSSHTRSFYARRNAYGDQTGPKKWTPETVAMHEAIVGGMADHISHNTLDNRRNNLRPVTNAQNAMNHRKRSDNTTNIAGVTHVGNRWRVRVQVNGKRRFVGAFRTAEEAMRARDEAAKELHGEFASLNLTELVQ